MKFGNVSILNAGCVTVLLPEKVVLIAARGAVRMLAWLSAGFHSKQFQAISSLQQTPF
jgi:hypothetical protein